MQNLNTFIRILILSLLLFVSANAITFFGESINTGSGDLWVQGVTRNSANDIIVVGDCSGSCTLDKDTSFDITGDQTFVATYTSDLRVKWYKILSATTYAIPTSVVVDSDDTITVAGYFEGTIEFSGESFSSNSSSEDVFLVQYDSEGNQNWHFVFGGDHDDEPGNQLALASDNSIFVCASIRGQLILQNTVYGEESVTSWFFARLSSSGDLQWAVSYPAGAYVVGLTADESSNAIIGVGTHSENITLGGTTLPARWFSLVLKISDSDGSYMWHSEFGDEENNKGGSMRAVAVDASGNIYVAGVADGNVTVGDINAPGAGNLDAFLVKYNSAGVAQWAIKSTGEGEEYFNAMGIGYNNYIFVCGDSYYTVNGTEEPFTYEGGLVAVYDTDGNLFSYYPAKSNTSDFESWVLDVKTDKFAFTWGTDFYQALSIEGTTFTAQDYGVAIAVFGEDLDSSSSATFLCTELIVVLLIVLLM